MYELGSIRSPFCVVFQCDMIAETGKRMLLMRVDRRLRSAKSSNDNEERSDDEA